MLLLLDLALCPWSPCKHAAWIVFAAPVSPRRSTDLRGLTARPEGCLMRILCSSLLSVLTYGLLLVCVGGMSGCDSKPADGTMVQDSGTTSEEEKSKVES